MNEPSAAATPQSGGTVSWTGRYFEDFTVGDVYRHPLGRTVTATDNAWLTLLTQNTAPLHFDTHYAAQTEFGKPLVDSTFTLALVTGQSVTDISQHVMANLGWDRVRMPNPLFEGTPSTPSPRCSPPGPPSPGPTSVSSPSARSASPPRAAS